MSVNKNPTPTYDGATALANAWQARAERAGQERDELRAALAEIDRASSDSGSSLLMAITHARALLSDSQTTKGREE